MLLKITESCSMGCTHCMNDAKPNGRDIDFPTLSKAIEFIVLSGARSIIVSGGEPTEHKEFEFVIEYIIESLKSLPYKKNICIATNGFWVLENQQKAKDIVAKSNEMINVCFQVSTDSRYYPKKLDTTKRIWREDGFLLFKECVQWVYPQGRAKINGLETKYKSSNCFNIRAISKQLREDVLLSDVIGALEGVGKFCTPAIRVDGSIGLGESDLCPSCSSIFNRGNNIIKDSKNFVRDIRNFYCKGCYPLNEDLPPEYKKFVE